MSPSTSKIADGKVVSIHYTLRDEAGEVLDSSAGSAPLDYLHGAGNIVPGLETGLAGREVGAQLELRLSPEEGYGAHDPRGQQRVPRAAFPADVELEPGMQFGSEDETGREVTIWISGIEGDVVIIDQNHPLAGKVLLFSVSVEGLRDATMEELEHGHPHGPHGHHHHG